jgi:hypothetical protein
MRNRIVRGGTLRTRGLLAVALLTAAVAGMSLASPALATPTGAFAVFADCPVTSVNACIYAKTESGQFTVGKKTVPIEKTIVLQGGLREVTETTLEFVGAKDGNTLTKVPQKVPGGLSGLVNCTEIKGSGFLEITERLSCEAIFENGLTGVTATTELAAPASHIHISLANLLHGTGVALELPVKVHLENPLLGSACYIGSNSSPIVIPLTTGTTSPPPPNTPIKGNPGTVEGIEGGEIIVVKNNSLVNNSFAAPATNGCGGIFEFLIAPIINSQLGVPSAAGHNTAILNGTLEQAGAESVIAHE